MDRTLAPVALGSGLGGTARVWIDTLMTPGITSTYVALLLINLAGCLAIGLFAGLARRGFRFVSTPSRQRFWMTGVCGGFTTFSLFSMQAFLLLKFHGWLPFLALSVATLAGGVLAAALGWTIARKPGNPKAAGVTHEIPPARGSD
jgi:CrcB protein